jgi:hypothetical protein
MENKTKYLLWSLGAIAVGAGGYFLFKHIESKKTEKAVDDFRDQLDAGSSSFSPSSSFPVPSPSPSPRPKTSSSSTSTSGFPLKYKSKGTLVKNVQLALIKKYGSSILPKYGADGDFGSEMLNALKAKGLPTVIESNDYDKITGEKPNGSTPPKPTPSSTNVDYKALAKSLHTAIQNDDIFVVLSALKKIKDTSAYTFVNEEFKKTRINAVRMTVVNALSVKFTSTEYKKKINDQYYRIGLKYNGTQWSLSGFYDLEDEFYVY